VLPSNREDENAATSRVDSTYATVVVRTQRKTAKDCYVPKVFYCRLLKEHVTITASYPHYLWQLFVKVSSCKCHFVLYNSWCLSMITVGRITSSASLALDVAQPLLYLLDVRPTLELVISLARPFCHPLNARLYAYYVLAADART
jgi:hypothetical protein